MSKGLTMYHALRAHATGQLKHDDTDTLKEYQTIVTGRLKHIDYRLTSTNLFKNEATELEQDKKWLGIIRDEIGGLLTRELHAKAL